jgi:hypothetical protein
MTATHLPAWVLQNFTQDTVSSLVFRPDKFSYAMFLLTRILRKNQPTRSYSWLGFISHRKIWMFNVSVLDNYKPVCHSSIKGLGPTFHRKDIFDFTILQGYYHLAASWRCMNNCKSPKFMSPDVLRASVCNGSIVFNLTKSSNLTGKSSYCILANGHHQCIFFLKLFIHLFTCTYII